MAQCTWQRIGEWHVVSANGYAPADLHLMHHNALKTGLRLEHLWRTKQKQAQLGKYTAVALVAGRPLRSYLATGVSCPVEKQQQQQQH
jgi:hypothetical protein